MDNSGTDVPVYGTNSIAGATQQHHNIFDMYQSFLGHFWGADRMGGLGDIKGMSDKLDQVFPGISNKVDQAGEALNDPGNIMGQIFNQLSSKTESL
jgi:hypothetical protein